MNAPNTHAVRILVHNPGNVEIDGDAYTATLSDPAAFADEMFGHFSDVYPGSHVFVRVESFADHSMIDRENVVTFPVYI